MENRRHKKKMREPGLFGLEKRKLKDFNVIFNNLMGVAKRQSQAVLGGTLQKDKRLLGKF